MSTIAADIASPFAGLGRWFSRQLEPNQPAAATSGESAPNEVVARRSESTRTIKNSNGTYTLESFSGPINFKDANGAWQPIDNTLVGSDQMGFAWQNRANAFQTRFAGLSGTQDVEITTGGESFTLTLAKAGVVSPTPTTPGVSGPSIHYKGIGHSLDENYQVTNVGLKETLVLKDKTAPSTFTYRLTGPAGSTTTLPDGSISVKDLTGNQAFVINAPWAAESPNGDDNLAEQGSKPHATQVMTQAVSTSLFPHIYELVVSVDNTWLSNSHRHFPIVVDPTLDITSNTRETYLSNSSPDTPTSTCGTTCPTSLAVGSDPSQYRTLLRFDVGSSQPGGALPFGTSITGATLNLQYQFCLNPGCGTGQTIELHRLMAGPWSSWDLGPNIKPTWMWADAAYDSNVLASVAAGASGGTVTHSYSGSALTSLVQQWILGSSPNDGFLLKFANEGSNQGGPAYRSARWGGSTMPKLSITYTLANGQGNGWPSELTSAGPLQLQAFDDTAVGSGGTLVEPSPFRSLLQVGSDLVSLTQFDSNAGAIDCANPQFAAASPPFMSWTSTSLGSTCISSADAGSNGAFYIFRRTTPGEVDKYTKAGSAWSMTQSGSVLGATNGSYSVVRLDNDQVWVAYGAASTQTIGATDLVTTHSTDGGQTFTCGSTPPCTGGDANFGPLNLPNNSVQLVRTSPTSVGLLYRQGTSLMWAQSAGSNSTVTVASNVVVGSPFQAAMDSNSTVHFVWMDASNGVMYRQRSASGIWSSALSVPQTSTSESAISLSVGASNTNEQMILMSQSPQPQLWKRTFNGTSWSNPVPVPEPVVGYSHGPPALAQQVVAYGVTPFVYEDIKDGGSPNHYVANFDYTDTTPPVPSITAPAANEILSGTYALSATATHPAGVSRMDFLVDRGGGLLSYIGAGTASGSTYSYNWNTQATDGSGNRLWPDGAYRVFARAFSFKRSLGTSTKPIAYLQVNDFGVRPYRPSLPFTVGGGVSGQVDLWNGNMTVAQSLVSDPSVIGPMSLTRTYNTFDSTNGSAGLGWSLGVQLNTEFNLKKLIDHSTDPNPLNMVEIDEANGARHYYLSSAANAYASYVGDASFLVKNGDGTWTLTLADGGRYTFSGSGDPTTYVPAGNTDANEFHYTYTAGSLSSLTDPVGRGFNFTYDTNGRLWKIDSLLGSPSREWVFTYDSSGRLTSVKDPLNTATTVYGYNSSNRMNSITTPAGVNYTFAYDSSNRVTDVYQHHSGQMYDTTIGYGAAGSNTRTVTRPKGAATLDPYYTTTYTLDGRHRTTSVAVQLPDGSQPSMNFTWTNDNLIQERTDFKNQPTDFTYDGADNTLTQTGPYNSHGQRPQTKWNYDEGYNGLQAYYFNNTTLTPPWVFRRRENNIQQASVFGSPAQGVNAENFSVRWSGYLIVPQSDTYTFYTDTNTGSRLYVDGYLVGDNWTDTYNGEQTWPGLQLSSGWHSIVLEYKKDTGNHSWLLSWSTSSLPKQVIPQSAFTPGFNLATSSIDPAGNTTTNNFETGSSSDDPFLGRLIDQTRTNNPVGGGTQTIKTHYVYNTYGQMTSKTSANGMTGASPDPNYTTTYTYYGQNENGVDASCGSPTNDEGLLKSVSQPGKTAITTSYDGQGLPVAQSDGKGTTCSTFDALGRQLTNKPPDRATPIASAFDADGRLTSVNDPLEPHGSSYTYDDLGRLATARDAMAAASESASTYVYDADSNLVSLTDKVGTTQYSFDQMDRTTQITDPAGRNYNYTFDANNLITKQTYPNGTETQTTYDNLQRISNRASVVSGVGTVLANDAYDRDIRGLITQDYAPEGLWEYTYDNLGRLEQSHNPTAGGNLRTRRFLYDLDSNRVEQRLNTGWGAVGGGCYPGPCGPDPLPTTIHGTDACGSVNLGFSMPFYGSNYSSVWISTNGFIQFGGTDCTGTPATSIDKGGDPSAFFKTNRRLCAPYLRELTVDPISNPGDGIFADQNLTGGPSVNIRWKAHVGTSAVVFQVTLNNNGWMTFAYGTMPSSGGGRVGVTSGTINGLASTVLPGLDLAVIPSNYPPDGNGRLVGFAPVADQSEASFGYNALDQLTASGSISGIIYNSDGDQTSYNSSSRSLTLGYDGRHLATSQSANGVNTTWQLDGEGRLTKQVQGSTEVHYRYVGPGDRSAWEEDASGNVLEYFIYGPTGLLATYSGGVPGTPTFSLMNGHGDVIQTRDLSHNLVNSFTYDEFGNVISSSAPGEFGYVGGAQKFRDPNSGLVRMGVRMYDPLIGRFTSTDPVRGADWTAYAYAGQDPLNSYDLEGLWRCHGFWGWFCHTVHAIGFAGLTVGRAFQNVVAYMTGSLCDEGRYYRHHQERCNEQFVRQVNHQPPYQPHANQAEASTGNSDNSNAQSDSNWRCHQCA